MTPTAASLSGRRDGRVPLAGALACVACLAAAMPAAAGDSMDARVDAVLSQAGQDASGSAERPAFRISPEVDAVRARLGNNAPLPLAADGRPMTDLAGVNYRLWMGRGSTELGVGLGTVGYVAAPDPRTGEAAPTLVGASPMLAVGLRHRVSPGSTVYADAMGTRDLGGEPHAGYVGTKLGIEWKPADRRFGFDHGALGIHLDSGYRIALKAHHGGLGIYLRGQF